MAKSKQGSPRSFDRDMARQGFVHRPKLLAEDTAELAKRWPLCEQFDLNESARVLVAGAYKGIVVRLLRQMYDCSVVGFEPQQWAARIAMESTWNDGRVSIMPLAIGRETGDFPMGEYHTDACSFVRLGEQWREHGIGTMADAAILLGAFFPDRDIALFVCNMEGYEFELLPYLAETSWLPRIERLAIQWHFDIVDDDRAKYAALQATLDQTHTLVAEPPGWQYWLIKPQSS